ncbi:hypothetical protein [Nostoc sp. JL34]|uniref:hypothetical protein n=1 Tax=Nostoc sp. JL34 TaxID=2815397 RepID=UPI00345ACE1E
MGETCKSNKRWKGIHACKDYIASYQDLHYRYGLLSSSQRRILVGCSGCSTRTARVGVEPYFEVAQSI